MHSQPNVVFITIISMWTLLHTISHSRVIFKVSLKINGLVGKSWWALGHFVMFEACSSGLESKNLER